MVRTLASNNNDIMEWWKREGYGVYPYDPLDSSLSEQDKINYKQ